MGLHGVLIIIVFMDYYNDDVKIEKYKRVYLTKESSEVIEEKRLKFLDEGRKVSRSKIVNNLIMNKTKKYASVCQGREGVGEVQFNEVVAKKPKGRGGKRFGKIKDAN